MPIDEKVWQHHIDEDIQQSKDICMLKTAMFGKVDKPDTVKNAVVPTMARLNTFLDAVRWIGGAVFAVVVTSPAWIPLIKSVFAGG